LDALAFGLKFQHAVQASDGEDLAHGRQGIRQGQAPSPVPHTLVRDDQCAQGRARQVLDGPQVEQEVFSLPSLSQRGELPAESLDDVLGEGSAPGDAGHGSALGSGNLQTQFGCVKRHEVAHGVALR
jgi:hypothetical protein